MKRRQSSPESTHAAIAAFLDVHYAQTHLNDVGPLLGRLASLRDGPVGPSVVPHQWNAAVSLALTGHTSEPRPGHRH